MGACQRSSGLSPWLKRTRAENRVDRSRRSGNRKVESAGASSRRRRRERSDGGRAAEAYRGSCMRVERVGRRPLSNEPGDTPCHSGVARRAISVRKSLGAAEAALRKGARGALQHYRRCGNVRDSMGAQQPDRHLWKAWAGATITTLRVVRPMVRAFVWLQARVVRAANAVASSGGSSCEYGRARLSSPSHSL